ncbi:hydrolase 2, exosortase A system-associated [Aromatoleum aromaticum]|nr:hydrolase 2, exosortase A system-associated [Aromatoleum aromaticum]NMG56092.1 hydrolase 2, exosortase A system-associated [Aromatoleum aromaticum]
MSPKLHAFHLHAPHGFRFCVSRTPVAERPRHGVIIHVPAFAEEMNKGRHMVALQADAWAQEGWTVLQIDLGGCGDSEGDFAAASWDSWLEDVRIAHAWGTEQACGPVWLWGLRLGALLASEAAARYRLECGLLLWQPVTSGKQHLQQFLRLWKMAQVIGKAGGDDKPPHERLAAGETVEVGGYEIAPALAQGIDAAQLAAVAPLHGVHWFQVGPAWAATPSPAFERLRAQWDAAGIEVQYHAVVGPLFWQTQEIELAQELLDRSRKVPDVSEFARA